MELLKLNLHFQALFLGKLIKNSENKIVENSSDNNITNISITQKQTTFFYFSYDDQINKKLIIFELLFNNSQSNQKEIYEIKYQEVIGNDNIHLFARGNLNNKIYFIFISNDIKQLYAGIYDLEINKYFPIILESDENNKKIKRNNKTNPSERLYNYFRTKSTFLFWGIN